MRGGYQSFENKPLQNRYKMDEIVQLADESYSLGMRRPGG